MFDVGKLKDNKQKGATSRRRSSLASFSSKGCGGSSAAGDNYVREKCQTLATMTLKKQVIKVQQISISMLGLKKINHLLISWGKGNFKRGQSGPMKHWEPPPAT